MPLKTYIATFSTAIIGGIGGMVSYLHHTIKSGKKFRLVLLFANGGTAIFLSYIIGSSLPGSMEDYRVLIAGGVGYFSYPILDAIEPNIRSILSRWAKKI